MCRVVAARGESVGRCRFRAKASGNGESKLRAPQVTSVRLISRQAHATRSSSSALDCSQEIGAYIILERDPSDTLLSNSYPLPNMQY